MPTRNRLLVPSLAATLLAACTADDGLVTTTAPPAAIDVIALAERPASLLVVDLADAAARRRFEQALDRMGGATIASLPPRLVIAQVPDGADAALADLGLVARFDRAVAEDDLAGATPEEARFLAVYSNRWQVDVPPPEKIVAFKAPVEAPEAPAAKPEPVPMPDPEDQVSVPFASGRVVVSIVLPESNGAIDPSTEDWDEAKIREAYLKVQAALDGIAEAEPNADLRFVMHYEPVVDSDYEFGQRAQWGDWQNESLATSHLLGKLLGRAVSPDEMWTAASEYQLDLRRRYDADAAFFVIVAANHNGTAGLRAHAYINGPWTVLDTGYGAETFAHEFGHIFGALDEYCPDACVPSTALHGYLGVYNANAAAGGEGAPSLMQYNLPGAINGYTRAAWGWIDGDGDGLVDVRDTTPRSTLDATVEGQVVRLTGQVVDRPAAPLWRTPYSINRIVGLEVALVQDGAVVDVVDVALPGDTRGRQAVDVALPALPAGAWTLEIRARNDAGNLEARPVVLPVTIAVDANTAPLPHLDLPELAALSSAAPVAIHADALDLDGDAAQVRVDLGGDGSFDTAWAARHDLEVTPPAGVWTVVVEARDGAGATATRRVDALVFAGNAPPEVHLANVPSLVHGARVADLHLDATVIDAEGSAAELAWSARLATDDGRFDLDSGWTDRTEWDLALATPERLATTPVDLAAGDRDLGRAQVFDVLAIDAHTVAVAGGAAGVWFVDVADPRAPVILGRVELETIARELHRDGDRLYVLGTMLAIVDISDLANPVEIEQLLATGGHREATAADVLDIPEQDGWGASHFVWLDDGERITNVRVRVTVDHPRPANLRITLHGPKSAGVDPIVLRDHVGGPGGTRTFTFTSGNTPALRALHGRFAHEGWSVEVVDDVVDGHAGRLVATELHLKTRSRAARVIPHATRIAGVLPGGELVVAGAGVETLDVTFPELVYSLARIGGTGTNDARLVGDTAILAMPLESKQGGAGPLRGLVAVDLAWPFWPEVVRIEDALGATPSELALVGSRLYVRMNPICEEECERGGDYTSVVAPAAFAAGAASWELGRSPLRVDRRAFGDDATLWTTGNDGAVQQYDVADPAALAVLASFPQSWAAWLVPLGGPEVLLFQWGTTAERANLEERISTLSRVFRVAVQARDDAGAIGRAYRTVHVIPYDHAPAVTAVEQVGAAAAGTPVFFRVFASDPDAGQVWDPTLLVRADWDGDGVFDSDWAFLGNDGVSFAELMAVYDRPGTYAAVFEVRDGFWASSRLVRNVTVE